MTDIFSSYECGVEELLERMGRDHLRYLEALALQSRLLENIDQSRRYGDNETRRTDRVQILDMLNQMALKVIEKSFNKLCELSEPGVPSTAMTKPQTASCIRFIEMGDTGDLRRIESHDRLITIGRSPKSTVCISDGTVSWEHGQIILMHGGYYYRHLSSINPSVLRRRGETRMFRPGKKEEAPLRNQDRLTIGSKVFIIEFDLISEDTGYTTTVERKERVQ